MFFETMQPACRGESPRATQGSAESSGSGSSTIVVDRELPHALPHEGAIALIALTDHGTAAVTVDGSGGARLWPALDGTREPLYLGDVNAPAAIALAETREGFALAIVDEAGGAQFLQLDHDGARVGTTSLPPEPGIKEIYARRDGFVVRTRDERIAWLDAYGTQRGSIAPPPGEQMLQLVIRRDHALVAFADETETASAVRWLTFDNGLALGPAITLANHLRAPLSLAPSAHRVAGGSFLTGGMEVIDLDTNTVRHTEIAAGVHASGFTSNGTAIGFGDVVAEWSQDDSEKGNRTTQPPGLQTDTPRVVADGVALSSYAGSLVVIAPTQTRYLGYRQLGAGQIQPVGSGFVQQNGSDILWFDRMLTQTVKSPLTDFALDDTHSLRAMPNGTFFMDLANHTQIKLDEAIPPVQQASYESSTGTLTVKEHSMVQRWRIDTAKMTSFHGEQLVTGDLPKMFALDPATSGYMVLGVDYDGTPVLVWWPEPGKNHTINARQKLPLDELPFAVDPAGSAYTTTEIVDVDHPLRITRYSPTGNVTKVPVPPDALVAALSPDGKDLAFQLSDGKLIMTNLLAVEKWRSPTRGTSSVGFSRDGRTVFSYGINGVSSFDRQTGKLLATACAWDFGFSETPIDGQVLVSTETCAGAP
ncbi:MAG TPA: hypothetical protein VGM90_19330 [Kofleriaceae bacterium]|jgi:hypothetical protein